MGLKTTTVCLGYQQITPNTATGLTVPALAPDGSKQQATFAVITPEGQNVRWRDDGTNPTASVGMPIYVGTTLLYDGDLTGIKFINTVAGGKINVSYYA
jgi:hypothetical protein